MNDFLSNVSTFLYSNILIYLLVFTGIFFSIRTKFVQIRYFPEALRSLVSKEEDGVSSLEALMISTSSRVGTGNIAGVATAIVFGGPGAVFWMWLIAIIGSASAFIESVLAQVYKVPDKEGYRGGPAYYIQHALNLNFLSKVFSVLLILTFAFGFNALQSYNIASAFSSYIPNFEHSIAPIVIGLVLALLSLYVFFGGNKRVGQVTSFMMPVMALIYIGLGLVVIFSNIGNFGSMISSIFTNAFNPQAAKGGFLGGVVLWGIKRGLFSNEAGMGSAPNAAAAAKVKHPVSQGLVQVISVFIDTIIICSMSAFMILITNSIDGDKINGIPLIQKAVSSVVGPIGIHIITLSIFLFAYSSIVGNMYYAESNFKFLSESKTGLNIFRVAVGIAVFLGAVGNFETVWNIADILMAFMALVNIFAIFMLSKRAVSVLNDYSSQKKEGIKDPVFDATKVGINDTYYWKGNLDNDN